MELSLYALLETQSLGLQVVAGAEGVDKRGPVRWAHISELSDPARWLEGGEILLTTGISLLGDPAGQRAFVRSLEASGCVALGFGVGVVVENVPEAMLEAADEVGLPLFAVPYEIPFIAVTKWVFHHTEGAHYAELREAIELNRRLLASAVGGRGIGKALEIVSRTMPDVGFYAFDFFGALLGSAPPVGAHAPDSETIRDAVLSDTGGCEGWRVTSTPLRVEHQVEGFLAVIAPRELSDWEQARCEQAVGGVTLELLRRRSVRSARREVVQDILEEILAGSSVALVRRRLLRIGFSPDDEHYALAIAAPAGVLSHTVCALAEDVLTGEGRSVMVGWQDGMGVCLVQPPQDQDASMMVQAVTARGWRATAVGVSRTRAGADTFATSIREAVVAAGARPQPQEGPVVRDIAELGVRGLVSVLCDDVGTDAFVEQVIGPVLAYDERDGTELAETLRTYLRHGCRPGPAAKELCVHRHTLGYRLDRIAELTGRDPKDGAHLAAFALALELEAVRSGPDAGGSEIGARATG